MILSMRRIKQLVFKYKQGNSIHEHNGKTNEPHKYFFSLS